MDQPSPAHHWDPSQVKWDAVTLSAHTHDNVYNQPNEPHQSTVSLAAPNASGGSSGSANKLSGGSADPASTSGASRDGREIWCQVRENKLNGDKDWMPPFCPLTQFM